VIGTSKARLRDNDAAVYPESSLGRGLFPDLEPHPKAGPRRCASTYGDSAVLERLKIDAAEPSPSIRLKARFAVGGDSWVSSPEVPCGAVNSAWFRSRRQQKDWRTAPWARARHDRQGLHPRPRQPGTACRRLATFRSRPPVTEPEKLKRVSRPAAEGDLPAVGRPCGAKVVSEVDREPTRGAKRAFAGDNRPIAESLDVDIEILLRSTFHTKAT